MRDPLSRPTWSLRVEGKVTEVDQEEDKVRLTFSNTGSDRVWPIVHLALVDDYYLVNVGKGAVFC